MKDIAARAFSISLGGLKPLKLTPLVRAVLVLAITALALVLVGGAVLMALLHPTPGEWALPVRAGPFTFNVGVPSAIRLANTPPVAQLLHGQRVTTSFGTLVVGWQPERRTLSVRCAPCQLKLRAFGAQPLTVDAAELTVQRLGESLWGTLAVGNVDARWQGQLSPQGLSLSVDVPRTPLHGGFAAFSAHIPELARARIAGYFALQATLDLPAGQLHATPQIEGFGVTGLGTEALRGALPTSCTPPTRGASVRIDSALARAVQAAEDQRFLTHPGYDLTEWIVATQANQSSEHRLRGASTLTQQVARLLFTGADRTPARKLRELLYAVEMERTLGKSRILQLYLQNAPWGDGVCGAEAAAQHYFERSASRLKPAQSVWLAAMLHAPDQHAQTWRQSGSIDTARAQWVASQVRPLSHRQHAALQRQLAAPSWAAPEESVHPED